MKFEIHRKPCHCVFALAIAAIVCAGILGNKAKAANQTWSGGSSANGNWSTATNWAGNLAPGSTASTTNTDVATFNAAIVNGWGNSGTPIVIDSATQNIGGLT